jgi:rhamnulokinase
VTALTVAAVDLGAESGRLAEARFDGSTINLELAARFPNTPVVIDGRTRWDVDGLWTKIESELLRLGARTDVASVGVDGWGVDYCLLRSGVPVELPVTYRDERRREGLSAALALAGPDVLYQSTGTQLLDINSIFALVEDARSRPELLRDSDLLLMLPDLFHRRLSGSSVTEYTLASTTGMFDIVGRRWATGLLDQLKVPTHFLPGIVNPGTDVGPLRLEESTSGLSGTRVIVPAAHDTASAVLAIPRITPQTMFISSGTWSLTGVVLDRPIVNSEAQRANLTNEGGYGGTIRFLKDVIGLWVLQECRRSWLREGLDISDEEIVARAQAERSLVAFVDVTAPEFVAPGDMPARIRAACARNGMPVPESVGQVARVAIDSLALAYRRALLDIEEVTGETIDSVAVVGGGTRNALLQQATASATGCVVTCWEREATALGNAAVQLEALGELRGIDEIWRVIEQSSTTTTFLPKSTDVWGQASDRLDSLRRQRMDSLAVMPGKVKH